MKSKILRFLIFLGWQEVQKCSAQTWLLLEHLGHFWAHILDLFAAHLPYNFEDFTIPSAAQFAELRLKMTFGQTCSLSTPT